MVSEQVSFGDRMQYVFARGLLGCIRRMPVGLSYRLGQLIGWLAWKLLKRRRATVRENLEAIYAWLGTCEGGAELLPGELEARVRELFIRNGANLLAGFSLGDLPAERMAAHVEIEGLEELSSAVSEGKGVIMLLGHMGPWEVLTCMRAFLAEHGVDLAPGAMYRALNTRIVDDWYKAQRERLGASLFSAQDGFHRPVEFLRSGGMLGILADQKLRQGETVRFFGRPAKTTPLPGLFQRRSGAPLCVLSIQTVGVARWRFQIRRVALPREADAMDRASYARVCNEALEWALAQSPTDGFWFSRRFV